LFQAAAPTLTRLVTPPSDITVSLIAAAPSVRSALAPSRPKPVLAPSSPPAAPPPAVVEAAISPPEPPITAAQMAPVSLTAAPTPLPSQATTPAPALLAPPRLDADPASACDPTRALQAELQGDRDVLDELSRVPRQARSVANAIMIWDGRWTPIDAPGAPSLADPLHQAIISTVRAMSPACQAQQVLGPRLLTVNDDRGSTVLALGSGAWTWSQILSGVGQGL